MIENHIRAKKEFYSRKYIYPTGLATVEDLAQVMIMSIRKKDLLNQQCVEHLIKLGFSPTSYLDYLQHRNKDNHLVSNLLNGTVYGLEEERHLKTYLIEKHKELFIRNLEVDLSSKQFYKFKKYIGKVL